MEYRILGKTGLEVSELSYGGAPLGGIYGDVDVTEGKRSVLCALDNGVNLFDVAPWYGGGLSEQRLGEALAGRRQEAIIATKVGRYPGGENGHFDFTAKGIRASVERSLRLLQTDVIDIYQVHDIEFTRREQILEESLPTMHQLKAEGKVRFIGVTGYPLQLLKDIALRAELDTMISYSRYHLMDLSLDTVLMPTILKKNIGMIKASPLNMGLLSSNGPPEWHPAPRAVAETAMRMAAWCTERGADLAELALQFALAYRKTATTLVGMITEDEVKRNLSALGKQLDKALVADMLKLAEPVAGTCWHEGLPENYDPGSVPKFA